MSKMKNKKGRRKGVEYKTVTITTVYIELMLRYLLLFSVVNF